MITLGGDCLDETISEMKLAVIPMMLIREMASIARTTVKVAPRAPTLEGIVGVGGGFLVLEVCGPEGLEGCGGAG